MLILYYKPTCPFSQRVLAEAEILNVKIHLKDISTDPVAEAELMERGGKHQTPYLYDDNGTIATHDDLDMYESGDIIAYLVEYQRQHTDDNTFSGVRIHQSDETCDTCQ